jgi:hypothetical protein
MRRTALVAVPSATTLCVCTCWFAGVIWWDGYYLPYKPCRPVEYPDGKVIAQDQHIGVSVPIAAVTGYYDRRLNVRVNAEDGQWNKENLKDARILYWCVAADINRLSAETGCIYLSSAAGKTEIQTMLLRGEGGEWPCPK